MTAVSKPEEVDLGDAPAALERWVALAERAGASDIHLQSRGTDLEISFRLDGVLALIERISGEGALRILGRIKYLARLKTYEDQLPQDGRIERADLNVQADVRVSTYPTVTGEKIVLRLFREGLEPDLKTMGISLEVLDPLIQTLKQPSGLVLLTGPAGSGKTTTIYGCIGAIRDWGGRHIITVEDPVERVLRGIMQTEVNEVRGLTFAEASRRLLRQDPQVLVIGEIRDEATAQLAVRAAMTGHLVLSTLHAGSCRGVVERLLALCPDRHAVAAALLMVVNQRLVRSTCNACSGRGCETCLKTGYQGRIPLMECLRFSEQQRMSVRQQELDSLVPVRSLETAARALVGGGFTTESELSRVLGL
jgi:type II secretory ATPase GspE/PulE/Tfp pilus assembly ATPase PilB-like protein